MRLKKTVFRTKHPVVQVMYRMPNWLEWVVVTCNSRYDAITTYDALRLAGYEAQIL